MTFEEWYNKMGRLACCQEGNRIWTEEGVMEVAWKAALEQQKSVAPAPNQLKAEIAALANELSTRCSTRKYTRLGDIIDKMRQLSAV